MPNIYLIEGPVGAGKSTHAAALAKRIGGVHMALDAWFATLFSLDRPDNDVVSWYVERKARLIDHMWNHALSLLAMGVTPILELGLVQRKNRESFYQRARDAGVELQIVVLDVPREVRRERVARRNVEKGPTFSMVVTEHIFEIASDMWQCPDAAEIKAQRIEMLATPPSFP
jgi:predicted kinase